MSFFAELKRRNVFRVGVAYVVGGWLLLQLTEVLSELLSLPKEIGPVVVAVVAIGFPIALFFAWAFELTPEGVKRESEVDRSQSITPQTGRKLNNTIVVLLLVAVGYLLFDKFSVKGPDPIPTPATGVADNSPSGEPDPALDIEPEKEAAINRQSIAVLPFDNRSNREEDQFFTDGIHDDLLTTIARIGSMKVISRTSVMEYKGTTKKIPEIAKELGVANILEGGIQRSGNQVRINVQLIDAVTDEHLWAQIFDRELTANNLFAIQSEISRAIAEALEATLSPEEQQRIDARPTENILAYDAYLRGRQLMTTRDSEDLTRATEEFGKAVNLDPQFALAWVGVADSHSLLTEYGTLNREEAILIRENAINHALEIDNQLAEAHASLGSLLGSKSRYKEAEEAYKKALELGPNYATAFHWYSNFLKNYPSRANETIALAEKAADLDPRSSVIGTNLASAYANRGLISMAERQLLKVIQQDPTFAIAYSALSGLYAFSMGQFDKALTYALKANELDPGNMRYLGDLFNIYTNVGDLVEPAEVIRKRMGDLDNAHRQTGFADLVINLAQNNSAGVREAINWVLPRISDNTFQTMYIGIYELILGDTQRARELYLMADPNWLDPEQWQDLIAVSQTHACVFSWILINTDDAERGRQLLQQTTVYLDETLPATIEHADWYLPDICYLTAGDTEKALKSIETQLSHNHLGDWHWLHKMPMYDLIRHEPRYQSAWSERERRLAIQRAAIAEMVAETGP